jgi:hypothetical protein
MNRVFIRGTEVVTKEYIDNTIANIGKNGQNYVIYPNYKDNDAVENRIAFFQKIIADMKDGKEPIIYTEYNNAKSGSVYGGSIYTAPVISENLEDFSGNIYFKSDANYRSYLGTDSGKPAILVAKYTKTITVTLTNGEVTNVNTPEEYSNKVGDVVSGILTMSNVTAYTPTGDYHPATKKYVDDTVISIPIPKTHDGEGIIGWYNTAADGENLTENYGVTPDMVRAIKAGDKISWPSRTMPGATENTICLYNMTYYVYNKDEMGDLETIDIIIGKVPNETYTYVIVGDNVYKNIF